MRSYINNLRECHERFDIGEFLMSSSSDNTESCLHVELVRPPSRVENPQVNDQEFQRMNAHTFLDSTSSHTVMKRIGVKHSLFEQVF